MDDHSRSLIDHLVEAYEPHVRRRVAHLGIDPPGSLDEALRRGADELRTGLQELLARPYREQRRGPLELFQEAMRQPTVALADAGVEPVPRDTVSQAALPGDLYDLAPASSQTLGEAAWQAHLAWGMAKAMALRSKGDDT